MMSAKQVYSACEDCTAKWFAKERLGDCPRCGSDRLMHTAARPPWEGAGDTRDGGACRDGQQGDRDADSSSRRPVTQVTDAHDSTTTAISAGVIPATFKSRQGRQRELFSGKRSEPVDVEGCFSLLAGDSAVPKRASTIVVMQAHSSFSCRRWYCLVVQKVGKAGRGIVRLELTVVDDASQAGRVVVHDVPAIVAPGSPLCIFLKDGFGIELKANESFDLTNLVGRRVEVRFTQSRDGEEQSIAAMRACSTQV